MSVFGSTATTAMVRFGTMGIIFLQTLVLARVFGAGTFGAYSVAVAIISVVSLVLSFGLDQVLMRQIAQEGPDHLSATPRTRDLVAVVTRLTAPLVVVTSVTATLFLWVSSSGGAYRLPMIAAFATLTFLVARKFAEAFALGMRRTVLSFAGTSIVFPIVMVAASLLVDAGMLEANPVTLAAIYVLATVTSSLTVCFAVSRQSARLRAARDDVTTGRPLRARLRALASTGLNLTLISTGFTLATHADVLLLALLGTPTEAALARVASRLAELVTIVNMLILFQFKPVLARLHASGQIDDLRAVAHRISRTMAISGILAFLTLTVMSGPALALFGREFQDAEVALRLYALGALFTMLTGASSTLLAMTNLESVAGRLLWLGLALNVILDLILIPFYGVSGAAFATVAAQGVVGLLTVLACRKLLTIDPSIFASFRRRPTAT